MKHIAQKILEMLRQKLKLLSNIKIEEAVITYTSSNPNKMVRTITKKLKITQFLEEAERSCKLQVLISRSYQTGSALE